MGQEVTWYTHIGRQISGGQKKAFARVTSIDDCRRKCLEETSFLCGSIEYEEILDRCILSVHSFISNSGSALVIVDSTTKDLEIKGCSGTTGR